MQVRVSADEFGEFLIMPKTFSFSISRTLKKKFTSTSQWILDMGIYKRENCKEIFRNAIEVRAVKIYLGTSVKTSGYNMTSSILHEIKDTPFTCLKELWFSQNQIESIEMVCRMKMPFLEEIWFRENRITTIKNLRKAHWPALKVLSLYQNLILDIELITELLCPELDTIWVEYEKEQHVQGEDLSWLVKTETTKLQNICIGSQQRMDKIKTNDMLSKKNNKKELRFFKNEEM